MSSGFSPKVLVQLKYIKDVAFTEQIGQIEKYKGKGKF